MSMNSRLRDIVEPLVVDLNLELFDLDFSGSVLVITIERPHASNEARSGPREPGSGVGIAEIAKVTRAVSNALDELDPIPGAYSLEVSSPGLERSLRTPLHFCRTVGQKVTIKPVAGCALGRRFKGLLVRAGEAANDSIDVMVDEPVGTTVTIPYDQIEKARTIFEWGGEPKPGKSTPRTKAGSTKNAKSKVAGTSTAKPAGKGKRPGNDSSARSGAKGSGSSKDQKSASPKSAAAKKTNAEDKKVTAS